MDDDSQARFEAITDSEDVPDFIIVARATHAARILARVDGRLAKTISDASTAEQEALRAQHDADERGSAATKTPLIRNVNDPEALIQQSLDANALIAEYAAWSRDETLTDLSGKRSEVLDSISGSPALSSAMDTDGEETLRALQNVCRSTLSQLWYIKFPEYAKAGVIADTKSRYSMAMYELISRLDLPGSTAERDGDAEPGVRLVGPDDRDSDTLIQDRRV